MRDGSDLHCTVPINIAQAALGAEIQVPTLDEPQTLTIPEGTQHGAQFRLRNMGMPHVNGNGRSGDLYVHVDVRVPTKLTASSASCWRACARPCPPTTGPRRRACSTRSRTTSC